MQERLILLEQVRVDQASKTDPRMLPSVLPGPALALDGCDAVLDQSHALIRSAESILIALDETLDVRRDSTMGLASFLGPRGPILGGRVLDL